MKKKPRDTPSATLKDHSGRNGTKKKVSFKLNDWLSEKKSTF